MLVTIQSSKGGGIVSSLKRYMLLGGLFASPRNIVRFLGRANLADLFRDGHVGSLMSCIFNVRAKLSSGTHGGQDNRVVRSAMRSVLVRGSMSCHGRMCSGRCPLLTDTLNSSRGHFSFIVRARGGMCLVRMGFCDNNKSGLGRITHSCSSVTPGVGTVSNFRFI